MSPSPFVTISIIQKFRENIRSRENREKAGLRPGAVIPNSKQPRTDTDQHGQNTNSKVKVRSCPCGPWLNSCIVHTVKLAEF
jgi:hypothetical protein